MQSILTELQRDHACMELHLPPCSLHTAVPHGRPVQGSERIVNLKVVYNEKFGGSRLEWCWSDFLVLRGLVLFCSCNWPTSCVAANTVEGHNWSNRETNFPKECSKSKMEKCTAPLVAPSRKTVGIRCPHLKNSNFSISYTRWEISEILQTYLRDKNNKRGRAKDK